jgi:hypothetical protein
MFENIREFGVAVVLLVMIFSSYLIPLLRKNLKAFDLIITQKEFLFKLNLNVEQLLSLLSHTPNCSKDQLVSLMNLYFSNVTLKLYRMIVNMRGNTELLKDVSLLRQMIDNNFEKILQDSNIYLSDFKYNNKTIDNIIVGLIDKSNIQQTITNIINNPNISNSDVQCLVDNLFIPITNNMKK